MSLTKVSYSMIDGAPFSVLDYGADSTGTTSSTAAIQAAIDAASAAGGGKVLLPAGNYLLSVSTLTESLWNFGVAWPATDGCLVLRNNVHLIGEGIGATKILSNDANKTVIQIADGNNIKISGMTVDGAWSGTGAGHGIIQLLSANDSSIVCENMVFENLFVTNVGSYGIGVANGNCFNVYSNNVRTHNTGSDGFDYKNNGSLKNNTGIFISNLYIEKFGQRAGLGVGLAGLDIRGVANVTNVQVKMTSVAGIGHVGIRFRTASAAPPDQGWGAKSSLANFYVSSDDTASVNTDNFGLTIGSSDVAICNGYIENCHNGVVLAGNANDVPKNVSISQVNVRNSSNRGFFAGSGCDRTSFTSCQANDCGVGFRVEADYVTLISCQAVSTTTGVSISVGANPTTQIIGCVFADDFGVSINQESANVVSVAAKGDSTNIDLQLIPKGSGKLKYGSPVLITTETLARYIEIKDQSGNVRKLAIVE